VPIAGGKPGFLKKWLEKARKVRLPRRKASGGSGTRYTLSSQKIRAWGSQVTKKLPRKLRHIKFNPKKLELAKVSEYQKTLTWGLIIMGVFFLAEISSRVLGLWIRPIYPSLPKSQSQVARAKTPTEDYDAILRRNMFNVEGKIPEPFDQGMLDCMSQAKKTADRIVLHGTIVMNDEALSVALIQQEGAALKFAVKKDEPFFDNKYIAMKIDRKRLCFQVKDSQDFEYVEIPDDSAGLGVSPSLNDSGGGITPVSESEYMVKNDFLQKNLLNLNEVLQTARAVPYVDSKTGAFKGFLIQSIDASSPFAALGIRQGDVLTSVNSIIMDNPGKGLEAFQQLRDAKSINLEVIRGGQKTTLNYQVK
jgi:general secretion pathway protein C